jgi:hypothetical protein
MSLSTVLPLVSRCGDTVFGRGFLYEWLACIGKVLHLWPYFVNKVSRRLLVFESPVRSGFCPPQGATANRTGSCISKFRHNRRLDWYRPVCRGCLTVARLVVTGLAMDQSRPVYNQSRLRIYKYITLYYYYIHTPRAEACSGAGVCYILQIIKKEKQ